MAKRQEPPHARSQRNTPQGNGAHHATPPARGPHRPRAQAPQIAQPDDPNGYRSPAFRDLEQNPYAIDYSGLPRDDEDTEELSPPAFPQFGQNHSTEMLTNHALALRGTAPRARYSPRRTDRTGTDPNAYRSPGYHNPKNTSPQARNKPSPQAPQARQDNSQPRRRERPRWDAPCSQCGAAASVPFEPTAERPALCKPCYLASKPERSAPTAPTT